MQARQRNDKRFFAQPTHLQHPKAQTQYQTNPATQTLLSEVTTPHTGATMNPTSQNYSLNNTNRSGREEESSRGYLTSRHVGTTGQDDVRDLGRKDRYSFKKRTLRPIGRQPNGGAVVSTPNPVLQSARGSHGYQHNQQPVQHDSTDFSKKEKLNQLRSPHNPKAMTLGSQDYQSKLSYFKQRTNQYSGENTTQLDKLASQQTNQSNDASRFVGLINNTSSQMILNSKQQLRFNQQPVGNGNRLGDTFHLSMRDSSTKAQKIVPCNLKQSEQQSNRNLRANSRSASEIESINSCSDFNPRKSQVGCSAVLEASKSPNTHEQERSFEFQSKSESQTPSHYSGRGRGRKNGRRSRKSRARRDYSQSEASQTPSQSLTHPSYYDYDDEEYYEEVSDSEYQDRLRSQEFEDELQDSIVKRQMQRKRSEKNKKKEQEVKSVFKGYQTNKEQPPDYTSSQYTESHDIYEDDDNNYSDIKESAICGINSRNQIKCKKGAEKPAMMKKIKRVQVNNNVNQRGDQGCINIFNSEPMVTKKQMLGLQYHKLQYKLAKERIDKHIANIEEILDLKEIFKKKRILCFKYNYSLEEIVQNFGSYQAIIEFNKKCDYLYIINRKPRETNKRDILSDPPNIDDIDDDPEFYQTTSSCSCSVDDIESIHFGGFQSRFWMLRKHINCTKPTELNNVPFFNWQCLSLQRSNRNVDLVIPNEQDMNLLLKFLITKMRTLDGIKGSANKILDLMQKQGEAEFMQKSGKKFVSDSVRYQIKQTCEHTLFRKVYLKYLIMRVRSKISYSAYVKRMTVPELLIRTIQNTHKLLIDQGSIPKPSQEEVDRHTKVYDDLNNEKLDGFIRCVVQFNLPFIKSNIKDPVILDRIMRPVFEKAKKKEEKVKVNKNGIQEEKLIDHHKNQMRETLLRNVVQQKDNPENLFQGQQAGPNQTSNKAKINQKKMAQLRIIRTQHKTMLIKHSMAISLKGISGVSLLRSMLRRIQLVKELFIIDVEQGQEVFIPRELSQDHLPLSFRFYDPLLMMIQERVSDESRDHFNLQNKIAFTLHREADFMQKFMERFGFVENGKEKKLTYKHSSVSNKAPTEICHHGSPHTLALQRSKYICIDNDISRQNILKNYTRKFMKQHDHGTSNSLKNYFDKNKFIQLQHLEENAINDEYGIKQEKPNQQQKRDDDLALRFCLTDEVTKKRQSQLTAKGSFLAKINALKSQGQKIAVMGKLEEFIDDNLESLYGNQALRCYMLDNRGTKRNIDILLQQHKHNYQQRAFGEEMLKYAENLLIKRRERLRVKRVKMIRQGLALSKPYITRAQFVDNEVYQTLKYFKSVSMLGCSKFMIDIAALTKKLRKNQEAFDKRQQQKNACIQDCKKLRRICKQLLNSEKIQGQSLREKQSEFLQVSRRLSKFLSDDQIGQVVCCGKKQTLTAIKEQFSNMGGSPGRSGRRKSSFQVNAENIDVNSLLKSIQEGKFSPAGFMTPQCGLDFKQFQESSPISPEGHQVASDESPSTLNKNKEQEMQRNERVQR